MFSSLSALLFSPDAILVHPGTLQASPIVLHSPTIAALLSALPTAMLLTFAAQPPDAPAVCQSLFFAALRPANFAALSSAAPNLRLPTLGLLHPRIIVP